MWYKVHGTYGPGHQGSETFYRWSETVLDKDGKLELADEMMAKLHHSDDVIVHVDVVTALPVSVRDEMASSCRSRIRNAQFMMDILGDPKRTPVKPCQNSSRKTS